MISSLTYAGIWLSLSFEHALSFLTNFGAACQPKSGFFGFPTWYKYLEGENTGMNCVPKLTGLNDIWLIVLAIIEILIRIAAVAAIVYVLYGGVKFITARGNPDKIAGARTTVIDALIGLLIAVAAIAVINYVGRQF